MGSYFSKEFIYHGEQLDTYTLIKSPNSEKFNNFTKRIISKIHEKCLAGTDYDIRHKKSLVIKYITQRGTILYYKMGEYEFEISTKYNRSIGVVVNFIDNNYNENISKLNDPVQITKKYFNNNELITKECVLHDNKFSIVKSSYIYKNNKYAVCNFRLQKLIELTNNKEKISAKLTFVFNAPSYFYEEIISIE
jgi:hypothetical protein